MLALTQAVHLFSVFTLTICSIATWQWIGASSRSNPLISSADTVGAATPLGPTWPAAIHFRAKEKLKQKGKFQRGETKNMQIRNK